MTTDLEAPGARLRRIVIALASVEVVAPLAAIIMFASALGSNEQLSRNIAQAAMMIAAIPLVILALPALILGIKGRALRIALALTLVALPVAAFLLVFA